MTKKIMVSACLLGNHCRYDGGSKPVAAIQALQGEYDLIPFCPEQAGELGIPRPPAEIQGGSGEDVWEGEASVMDRTGKDCTAAFRCGAEKTLAVFDEYCPVLVITKANSPSCGLGQIYDGSFSGQTRSGNGVTTALLLKAGARMVTETEFLKNPSQILDEENS